MTSANTVKPAMLNKVDVPTSLRMARTPGRDNGLEKEVRSALHRRGIRFRLHYPVPSRPRRTIDIALPVRRLAIFVDGCFWHGCPVHGTWPKRNSQFWRQKIETNRQRDRSTDILLTNSGWLVVRVWEHDDLEKAVERILRLIAERNSGSGKNHLDDHEAVSSASR